MGIWWSSSAKGISSAATMRIFINDPCSLFKLLTRRYAKTIYTPKCASLSIPKIPVEGALNLGMEVSVNNIIDQAMNNTR